MNVLKILSALLIILGVGFGLSSCGDTKGCTDPLSSNYDPDATEDDGTCIGCTDPTSSNYSANALSDDGSCNSYARSKFFGDYLGDFDCASDLLSPKLDSDSLYFSVKEPVSSTNAMAIILGLTIDGIPVDLEGVISDSGDTLLVDDTLKNFSIPDFPVEGITTVADVIGKGFAVLSPDEQNLKGALELTIAGVDGSFTATDDCELDGNKL